MEAASVQAMRERSGWQLQPARDEDHRALLAAWIAADPDHAGRVSAAWWFQQDERSQEARKQGWPTPAVENLLLVDREGALFFLRCSNAMRMDIQFAPSLSPGSPYRGPGRSPNELRTARALGSGLPWLAAQARNRRYAQMIYESRSPRLVRFLERIGFRETSTEHVLSL